MVKPYEMAAAGMQRFMAQIHSACRPPVVVNLVNGRGPVKGGVLVEHAVFAGDILHTPAQLIDLSLSSRFCHDAAQAAQTRSELVHQLADTTTLLFSGHFPSPTAGRIVSLTDHFRFHHC